MGDRPISFMFAKCVVCDAGEGWTDGHLVMVLIAIAVKLFDA
jgi:hypothetical protein